MAAGIIGMAAALYMDFSGSASTIRGPLLIAGALLVIAGVYLLPTRKHRSIINVLFLFPLIFAFAVTVLIPFACGIFYSMTDWNGIKFEKFVGLGNYISMFKSNVYPAYCQVLTIKIAAIARLGSVSMDVLPSITVVITLLKINCHT